MGSNRGLALQGHFNELVPVDGTTAEVAAVLSVSRSQDAPDPDPAAPGDGAVVLVLDPSDAVAGQPGFPEAVRDAARAALAALLPGTRFAVVAAGGVPTPVHPAGGGLDTAADDSLAEAQRAVDAVRFGGPLALGAGLTAAADLLAAHPGAPRRALLVVGGPNGGGPEELRPALDACRGRLAVDVRAIGRAWRGAEVRAVADALPGSVEVVADPVGRSRLAAEVRATVEEALARTLGDVVLEVRTRADVQLVKARQVAPSIERLARVHAEAAGLSVCYGTGAWGVESREFLLSFAVRPGPVGERALLARVVARLDEGPGKPLAELGAWTMRVRWADPSDEAARLPDPYVEALGVALPPEPAVDADGIPLEG